MRLLRLLTGGLLVGKSVFGCSVEPSGSARSTQSEKLLSRAQALAIAEAEVRRQGFDLSKYVLSDFNRGLSEDGKKWSFLFLLGPAPPPGATLLVMVNRRTGAAELIRGM